MIHTLISKARKTDVMPAALTHLLISPLHLPSIFGIVTPLFLFYMDLTSSFLPFIVTVGLYSTTSHLQSMAVDMKAEATKYLQEKKVLQLFEVNKYWVFLMPLLEGFGFIASTFYHQHGNQSHPFFTLFFLL